MRPDEELERRYRNLLRAYPRGYREHRGEEMLATLMETARHGQTRPDRQDVAEILRSGLRERLGMHCAPGLVAGVTIAGPVCLAVATAIAVATCTFNPGEVGFAVVAGAWVLAALAYLAVPRVLGWTIGAALIVTIGAVATVYARLGSRDIYQPYWQNGRPMVFVGEYRVQYALTLVCGLIALLSFLTVHWRRSTMEQVAVAAGIAVAVADTLLVRAGTIDARLLWTAFVRPLPLVLLVAGVVVVAVRRTTAVLWAGLLLSVPTPLIASWGSFAPQPTRWNFVVEVYAVAPLSPFSLTGISWLASTVALGAAFVVAVIVADAHRRTMAPRDGRAALATLGALALGTVAAICGLLLADTVYHGDIALGSLATLGGPLAAAVVAPFLPARLRRAVLLLALAGVLTVSYSERLVTVVPEQIVVVVLLLVIATAELRPNPRLVGAAALGAVAVGAALNWFTQGTVWLLATGWPQRVSLPVVGGVVIAFAVWWAPYVLIRAERFPVGALFAFAAGLLWLALHLALAGDSPRLIAVLLVCVGGVVAARLVVRWRRRAVAGTG